MGATKRLWLIIAVLTLIAGHPTTASAQWIDLPYAKPFLLQVDSSSALRILDGEFRVSWRFGRDLEKRFSEYSGRIDCFDIRVVLEHETVIDRTGWPDPMFHAWHYNYRDRTSEYGGRKSVMNEEQRWRAVKYPEAGSSEFQVMRYLCESEPGFKEQHELRGESLQARNRCDRADNAAKAMCKPDQETRELLGLLTIRTVQIEEACEVDSDELDSLLAHWLLESSKCRPRGGKPCGLSSLRSATYRLGEDLARAQLGQPCRYIPIALQSMQEKERDEIALDLFRMCITKTIPALDDRISPANIVAEGAIASCRSHLPSDLTSGTEFTSGILPTITAEVLRARKKPRSSETRESRAGQDDVGGTVSKKK